VAFIHESHGMELGEAVASAGIKKRYYLETRGDVLLRNKEVFRFWKKLGVSYMFLGLEALDEDGLKKYRKRVPLGRNFEALEFARSLGVHIAINLIADPDWDHERFRVVREWCLEQPEIVNISVNTPYPGTESWLTEERRLQTRDYRLFDIQHAVLPTRLPLEEFYAELVATQRAIYRKHIDWHDMRGMMGISARLLLRGQTNFVKSLFKLNSVYRTDLLLADHARAAEYEIPLPPPAADKQPAVGRSLYVHAPRGRAGRAIDAATEQFVDETRMGAEP
jgi:hopanoid C-3 methylase HpnR